MKLEYNPNCQRQPFGGHHFTERGVTMQEDTLEELTQKLTDFRVNNGLILGNPLQDILAYYQTKWPYLVQRSEDQSQGEESARYTLWRSWLHATWKNPPKNLIPLREAKERWEVCKDCKFNRKRNWVKSLESLELTRRAFMLRRGIDVPDYLGFCAYHGADLGVFTMLEHPESFSKAEGKFDYCWFSKLKDKND
jgi:hypothetical protein